MVSSFRSPKSTVRGRRSPFRMISSSTLVPGASPATLRDRAEGVSTRRPSTFAMMSPGFRPARAAGSFSKTSFTRTPSDSLMPNLVASSAVTSWMPLPSQPRTTSAVARVDRGVGLDEGLVAGQPDGVAFEAADHPHGEGPVQGERIANRHDPLADADLGGVAERHRGKRPIGRDLHDSQVSIRIAADHLADVLAFVGEPHLDLLGVPDDVIVGHHNPVFVHDDPRAGPWIVLASLPRAFARFGGNGHRADIDHGRLDSVG